MTKLFPHQKWMDQALGAIASTGLDKTSPIDSLDFRVTQDPTSWLHLLSAIAKHESNFDPNLEYKESGHLSNVISTGLFQLSYESVRGYGFSEATTEKLKDPLYNISVAVHILHRWVSKDGMIASKSKPWEGGARYWSVLRHGAPKVKASIRSSYPGLVDLQFAIPREVELAYKARLSHAPHSKMRYIFEINYGINSAVPRLFIWDMRDNTLSKYKCSHGIGGGNRAPHDGVCREVSNLSGSHMTCLGSFRTADRYNGSNGLSLRMRGLDPANSNAYRRHIVFHGADYVNEGNNVISGRSWGCPSTDHVVIEKIIAQLEGGSIGFAHLNGKTSSVS